MRKVLKGSLGVLGVWVGVIAVLLLMAWSVEILNALSPNAEAGEGPNVGRQVENLNRSLQQAQDDIRKLKIEQELIKQLPTVAKEYKALLAKIERERPR